MPADNPVLNFLLNLLPSCPAFLIWLVGGLIAVATWRKHPGVSGLVLAQILWQMFVHVLHMLVLSFLPQALNEMGVFGEDVRWGYRGVNFLFSIGYAIGYLLLLVAVFKWRGASGTAPPPA